MEAIKDFNFVKSVVIITTDKVYQNYKEQKYFNENSQLGGDDIYSGSKACCELLTHSYRKSFLKIQIVVLQLLGLETALVVGIGRLKEL